jgi:alkylresorcinol/alkylpyrone synthase
MGVAAGFPQYYYSQAELTAMLARIWQGKEVDPFRLEKFHQNMQIQGRYLALPMAAYEDLDGFGAANDAWIRVSLELGEKTLRQLFQVCGVAPLDIHALITTSVTGIAVPSIDARLMNRISFKRDLKRMPLFGLGCLGGAAGLARAADYLRGHPDELAVLLAVELCSLTLQRDDVSIANLVSSGLFGDGAAAVLMAGADFTPDKPGKPVICATESVFLPGTEYLMGYSVRDSGFKMILGADVHTIVLEQLGPAVHGFLKRNQLEIDNIGYWIVHPGGPKIIDAVEKSLELAPGCLEPSRSSLARVGNVSSASVLLILEDLLSHANPPVGSYGMLMAMGPGFSIEMVLLKW